MDIASPDYRNIIGNPESYLGNSSHRANRNRIVIAEDAVRYGLRAQQLAHGVVTGAILVTGFYHVAGRYRQIAFRERPTVAFHSARGDADPWAAKMCNPLTATLDKVNCGQLTDGFVVYTDETGLDPSNGPVN